MIFYFSGTGNSEWAAKQIAEALGDTVVSIGDCTRNGRFSFAPTDGEQVGFVFPAYFYGVPTIVLDFIQRLDLQGCGDNYTFALCASGGDPANAHTMFRRALSRKGLHLDAAFELTMPDNYILMFDLLTPPDKAARLLEAAEGSIAAIISAVAEQRQVPPKSGIGRWLKTTLAYPLYKYGRKTDRFYALADCNGCGLCARVCPCSMIEMQGRDPAWKSGRCTQCLACLHRCPKRAVQYGKKTLTRGRYVNPNAAKPTERCGAT